MSTYKFYEIFEQGGGLVSTGRSIYATGETLEDCSFAVFCFMCCLNKMYPTQYHFDPVIDDDKTTVRYYKHGEGVNASLAMVPAEEYPSQNWLSRNMEN